MWPNKQSRMDKIEKTKEPGPGEYNSVQAIEKTQWVNRIPSQVKAHKVCYTDTYKKLYKENPGPGNYPKMESAYSKVGMLSSLKGKR